MVIVRLSSPCSKPKPRVFMSSVLPTEIWGLAKKRWISLKTSYKLTISQRTLLTILEKRHSKINVDKEENCSSQHFLLFLQCLLSYQTEKTSLKLCL